MTDRAQPRMVTRVRLSDLFADPDKYGFEECWWCKEYGSVTSECPWCSGLGLQRKVEPCVGCGHCCLAATCTSGRFRMAQRGLESQGTRCAYLSWDGDRYWCGLAGTTNELMKKDLGHGDGCCQPLNSWRKDVRFRG